MKQFSFLYDPEEIRKIIREELQILQKNNSPPIDVKQDIFLDIDEASKYLKISKSTLRKKCQKMEIPCIKRCGKWIFNKKEITNWLLQGKQNSINF
ncbi:helix-turn-helix domain-containing protein [Aquimarina sp. U1-2]|uniref:helix-turn-helix domain-containing protein n=1 Tax=Aquimarina sp. U1-2 TaxID=2823141 RepID=UPI001AECA5FE|nr:helix-turn-helix domain-containing protein [Aquimarina sp. U1-2]MBP2833819.1 helix-turn-helix domain-containing protein [Aquimarina sp. U1-2]